MTELTRGFAMSRAADRLEGTWDGDTAALQAQQILDSRQPDEPPFQGVMQ